MRWWLESLLTMSGVLATGANAAEGTRAPTWLALGDSYTIGEGVSADGRWPSQLAAALRADGIAIADPRIIAQTGWTTGQLAAAIDAAQPPDEYDFVSLLIGVNNQYRGRSAEQYRDQFAQLLERAIALAGGRADRVMALSIPDWGVTPFAGREGRDRARVARELDVYNAIAAQSCAERGVAFVDITAISRAHGAQRAMLAEDGLHPSAAMYALWTQAALPVARDLLAR